MLSVRTVGALGIVSALLGCGTSQPPVPAGTVARGERFETMGKEMFGSDDRLQDACKTEDIAAALKETEAQPPSGDTMAHAWLGELLDKHEATQAQVMCCVADESQCIVLAQRGDGARRPGFSAEHKLSESSVIYYDSSDGAKEQLAAYEMVAAVGDGVVAKVAVSWMP